MNLIDLALQAAEGAPPAPVPVAPVSTGTEMITSRELATLASSLARSKSADKQSVGRALMRAIKGEIWAQQGQRNATAYQISAEVIETYPGADLVSVVQNFLAAISNAQTQGSKMTETKWLGMLERVQAERGNRIAMVAASGERLIKALETAASWPTIDPVTPDQIRTLALNTAGIRTLVIRAGGDYYIRTPDRGTYAWKITNEIDLRTKLVALFGSANATVVTHDKGEFIGPGKFCETYATVAARTIHDYRSPATTYDLETETIHVGLPAILPEPVADLNVHAWLLELAGGEESDLVELYDWISSTTREHIDRPAAALTIVGARDAGKTLFVQALARTWGILPVKLANSIERFNGSLCNSPFWHADERMPEDMTDAAFREIVQERSRLVEPKGREKVELRGCGRLIFTLNSSADLKIGSASGADVIDAVAGRLAYFDCSLRSAQIGAAQDRLRIPGSFDLDMPRIVGHLRWVQETYRPRAQRFFGARQDGSRARRIVLQQAGQYHEQATETLIDYLSEPEVWERSYQSTGGQFAAPGSGFPIVIRDRGLWVCLSELAAKIGVRQNDLSRALVPFTIEGTTKFQHGAVRNRYRRIDVARMLESKNIARGHELYYPIVQTLIKDTQERIK